MTPPRWTHLMIHHSAGGDTAGLETEAFRTWHVTERGWADIGYHYVVERIGVTYQALAARPLFMPGAHCPGWNQTAVGICLAGNFEAAPPPSRQLEVAARLTAGLCAALLIPPAAILQHRDHRATACPGRHFALAAFRRQVAGLLGHAPPAPETKTA